jgi:hypothetical protein
MACGSTMSALTHYVINILTHMDHCTDMCVDTGASIKALQSPLAQHITPKPAG